MNISRFLILPFILISLLTAQDIGPGFEGSKTEIGISQNFFTREFIREYNPIAKWGIVGIYLRSHLFNTLTASISGYVNHSNESKKFPKRKYEDYSIGLGLSYTIIKFDKFNIGVSSRFLTRFSFDKSVTRYHKRTENYFLGVYVSSKKISFKHTASNAWIAPSYVRDEITEYPYNSLNPHVYKSINNFGIAGGISILFFDHIRVHANTIYLGYFQYDYGIGIQI